MTRNQPPVAPYERIAETFRNNVQSVDRLMTFDQLVLDTVLDIMGALATELEAKHRHNEVLTIRNRISLVRNIKSGGSMRLYYDTILNQCVVLLVAHFASALHDIFRHAVDSAVNAGTSDALTNVDVKAKLGDLFGPEEAHRSSPADLLLGQSKTSFQDMQSVTRAFAEFLQIATPEGSCLEDIIVGQACRHCIVHNGGVADHKLLRQLRGRKGSTLASRFEQGSLVQFSSCDVTTLAAAMTAYLDQLLASVGSAEPSPQSS